MTPEWFTTALAAPTKSRFVESAGANVHYRIWGAEHTGPGVLLVHGNTANTHWWDHIAPALATDRRVVAIDLTGFGDSGRREKYSFDLWADDIRTVLDAALPPGSVIVAHSMGGKPSYLAATRDAKLGGLVLLDSNIARKPDPDRAAVLVNRADTGPRIYPEREDAVRAYRLFRPDDSSTEIPAYVTEHIARSSVRRVADGWSWKFDYAVYRSILDPPAPLRPMDFPVAVVRAGHHSVIDDDCHDKLLRGFGPSVVAADLPNAGHHAMLDDPQAVIDLLLQLLSAWR
ncbi:alpha/beta hydrolase [Aldersonia sp. NBC_00410]|uniref:alpha/beta fold hydrolase n=1 Tax=Aldersonia sp. NBC_00410 TaxID=2975954 RepID=UPI002253CB0A|nr:alpha/beta hydrolase [Aldersonia sp. NBC_00410]MCX5041878.1 alpha/beta hydrolase [Aldersonia sp. NBC_00410]